MQTLCENYESSSKLTIFYDDMTKVVLPKGDLSYKINSKTQIKTDDLFSLLKGIP